MRMIVATALCLCTLAIAQDKPASPKSHEIKELSITLIRIEPGEFLMGSPDTEPGHHAREHQHKVKITKPFYIASTEVTQAQWKVLMGNNPSYFKGDNLPVENVSWEDARRFCEKLSEREKRKFRLPTEAEWEYACRAGKQGPVAGTGKLDEMAWYADNSGDARVDSTRLWKDDPDNYFKNLLANKCRTRPVGTAKPNDWGLYDMQGNVTEWVADWLDDEYYKNSPAADPAGPEKSELESRVLRGGSWGNEPANCRAANRDWNRADTRSGSIGFRIAMDAE